MAKNIGILGKYDFIFLEALPNNVVMKVLFDKVFLRFSDPEIQLFSAVLQLWSLESL